MIGEKMLLYKECMRGSKAYLSLYVLRAVRGDARRRTCLALPFSQSRLTFFGFQSPDTPQPIQPWWVICLI